MFMISTILHPTDFSPMSEKAFHFACSLARDHGARIIALHVGAPPSIGAVAGTVLPPDPERYQVELEEKTQEAAMPPPDIRVEERVEFGDPASVILQVAAATKCDLIVMGTHGRIGLERLWMGSVAEQVSRKASCPVVTVNSHTEDAKSSRKEEPKAEEEMFVAVNSERRRS